MSEKEVNALQKALDREKAARKEAEKILEVKSLELYNTTKELKKVNHKLEDLLDEKTSQLQGVFENIIDAYLVMDIGGNVLKMNDAAVELFGYNVENEKLNVLSLIYKEDFQYAMQSFAELNKNGVFTNYKARVYTKNKEVKWVSINASLIYDRQKKPIAAQGIIRDITQAKLSAQTIEEQKKELAVIVDNSFFGIALAQFGKIIKTNVAFQNLFGYTENELKELTIQDISVAEDFPLGEEYSAKMIAGEIDDFVVDKRYKRKDGSIIWAKTNVKAVRDSAGNIKYQMALVEDITEQREKTLIIEMINDVAKGVLGKVDIHEIAWEIINKISEYLDSDDCGIYLVNSKERTVEQIAAHGAHNAPDNFLKKIFPFGEGIVGTIADTGTAQIINDTSKDKRYIINGERRYSEIVVPILSDGEVIGLIDSEHPSKNHYTKSHLNSLQNVARLVAMQLKSAINLRERRKAEERNSQLLIDLEKSNQDLQDYAHIVSHDLKSPLRSISALVSWLKDDYNGVIDENGIQNFAHIETKIEKMDHLIDGILKYSSIDQKNMPDSEVDLNEIINDITDIIFIPSHIKVTVVKKLPTIKADSAKIQQLFQNLISNAVNYMDKEEGLVQINYEENATHYIFSVKDNGVGIEPMYHEKIFKIFNSLEDSTGIGLSIVKKVVELYKGEIWLESEVKKGTTFFFSIKKQ